MMTNAPRDWVLSVQAANLSVKRKDMVAPRLDKVKHHVVMRHGLTRVVLHAFAHLVQ